MARKNKEIKPVQQPAEQPVQPEAAESDVEE